MSTKEKYIGEAKIKDKPKKKIGFKIADGAVTTDKIQNGAVTKDKMAEKSVGLPELASDVHQALASVHEGGIAVTNDFGDSEYIGISQKTITEMKGALDTDIADINTAIGEDETEGTLKGRIGALEESDVTINQSITAESNRAQAAEVALANGIEGLTQSNVVIGALPQSGVVNTIYRVPGESNYKDYAWNGSTFVQLATYNNAIDETLQDSNNLVKNKAIYGALYGSYETITVDGTTVGTVHSSYIDGTMDVNAASTYRRRSIPNNNYTHIKAKVILTIANPLGMCAIAFNTPSGFQVPDDSFILYNKMSAMAWFESDIPENCTSISVSSRSASTYPVEIELTQRAAVTPGLKNYIDEKTAAILSDASEQIANVEENVSEVSEEVENISLVLEGGEETEEVDGKAIGSSSGTIYYTLHGSVKSGGSSGSYTRWAIANNDYKKISAYLGFNTDTIPNNGDGFPFIFFIVGPTFVPDLTKGYIYAKNGETIEIEGEEYVISNVSGKDIVYYEEDIARAKKNSITITDREIPEGTITIYVCTRNSAVGNNSYITLSKTSRTSGLTENVQNIDTRLSEVEARIPEGEEDIQVVNTDQDCLILRNYINETYPHFFEQPSEIDSYDAYKYLDTKIKNIPKGKHFIFLTDTHWKDNPSKACNYIASYVSKRLGGCITIFGGDAVNSNTTKYLAINDLSNYAEQFYAAFGDNGLWVQGNHDSNVLPVRDSGLDPAIGLINDIEVYKRTVARIEHKVTFDEIGIEAVKNCGLSGADLEDAIGWMKLHYHYDDTFNKIRYIVCETGCGGTTLRNHTPRSHNQSLMLVWLSRVLLSTPDNFDIVIASHMWGSSSSGGVFEDDSFNYSKLLSAFRRKASITINLYAMNTSGEDATPFTKALCGTSANKTFNFTQSTHQGKLISINGHWHRDKAFIGQTYNGTYSVAQYANVEGIGEDAVLYIWTNCDNLTRDVQYTTRARNSVEEVLFDIVTLTETGVVCTRIGAGEDRSFNLTVTDSPSDDTEGSEEDDESSNDITNP